MTATHQLETTLRALKLSGMLDTLEARLGQARAGSLGHLEFLQVLCEDEIARREAAAVGRRLRAAHFEQPLTLEGFDFTASPKLPAATIRDLATLRFLDVGESLILYGPVGVGKTHCETPSGCSSGEHRRVHRPAVSWPQRVTGRLGRAFATGSAAGTGRRDPVQHAGATRISESLPG